MAKKLRAFGMNVQYHNPKPLSEELSDGAKYVAFEELLKTSDIISLNLPLNVSHAATFGLLFRPYPIFHIRIKSTFFLRVLYTHCPCLLNLLLLHYCLLCFYIQKMALNPILEISRISNRTYKPPIAQNAPHNIDSPIFPHETYRHNNQYRSRRCHGRSRFGKGSR